MENIGEVSQTSPKGRGPFCMREIIYRILALIFLILAIAAVLFIAEASAAPTYETPCEMYEIVSNHQLRPWFAL